jgi:hypothetical protein
MQPFSRDAVVVVPGIMGSELIDVATGRVLWGLKDPRWYISAWTSGASLMALRLSEDERAGRYGRVRPGQLLEFPAFAPMLGGFAPYTQLTRTLRAVACHPDAVSAFPYDWRLPVAYNGDQLAEFAARHLAAWRTHPQQEAARRQDPNGDEPARLVLIAHSMGGLVTGHACLDQGLAEQVRAVVTLGTPFFGAPKAVLLMSAGRRTPVPLPSVRVRELAVTLPGLYDLLPGYRCVGDGTSARRLTEADIAAIAGDRELAAASFAWQEKMQSAVLPGHVQVAGVEQPTVQALTLDAGTVTGHRYTYRPSAAGVQHVDAGGDGTVPRDSAQLPDGDVMPIAQAHGSLASSDKGRVIARDVLVHRRTEPWQGAGDLGLEVPDVVPAGRPYTLTITGAVRPTEVTCSVIEVSTGREVDVPRIGWDNGALAARAHPLPEGLYWVQIIGSGASPVTQMLMAVNPDGYGPDGAA